MPYCFHNHQPDLWVVFFAAVFWMSRNAPPKGKEREKIGSLRGYGHYCNQNATSKLDLALGLVFCDYSMFVTLHEIGEVSRPFTCIGTNGFHVKAEKERFTSASSRCRQNLKYGNSTSSFGRLRQKIAPKGVLHDYLSTNSTNRIIGL